MWPAKLPGEGNALLEACSAMCDIMKDLGIAVDGGKDSLSMAARVGSQTVKSPGTLKKKQLQVHLKESKKIQVKQNQKKSRYIKNDKFQIHQK